MSPFHHLHSSLCPLHQLFLFIASIALKDILQLSGDPQELEVYVERFFVFDLDMRDEDTALAP